MPAKATSFRAFIPVIFTLLGIHVLHEPFAFQTAIGAALVLGGVALAQQGPPGSILKLPVARDSFATGKINVC